jgi:hypothetical protein
MLDDWFLAFRRINNIISACREISKSESKNPNSGQTADQHASELIHVKW